MSSAKTIVLNISHTAIAGSLMALTAGGLTALVYGLYRIKYVKPQVLVALQNAAVTEQMQPISDAPTTTTATKEMK